jgi:hypothetical protein
LFSAAVITASRPVGFSSATRNFEALHPEDIMVCIGEPVTDSATAGALNYFGQQAKTFDTQRIGLTSPTLRVVPLTRDYDYAADRLGGYAKLAGLQHAVDTGQKLPDGGDTELRSGISSFSRGVGYVDYAPSTEDILALCMAGFGNLQDKSIHRRSLVYVGYGDIRDSAETRPALFSTQKIKDMAAAGGIQINAIARTDIISAAPGSNKALEEITKATGGRFSVYNPAGTAVTSSDQTDPMLAGLLDQIRNNPPDVVLPDGKMISLRSWDYPNLPLTISLVAAVLLSATLAVLRR